MTAPSARDLVLRHGWHPSAYQTLNPGIRHWFSSAGDAVIGYADHGRVRVVAGEPVCETGRLGDVIAEFEAASAGQRICFLAAEQRLADLLGTASGYASAIIGAHPIVRPTLWSATVASRPSLRAQLNRARNKGVRVTEWPAAEATSHPALQDCLARWLATRPLPPLHFLVEPGTLERLDDRRTFVATVAGNVEGFVVATPIPQRNGWLIEQVVRRPRAPNGTAELLIDRTIRTVAAEDSDHVALGVAPLSERAGSIRAGAASGTVLAWVRAHSRRFYNFSGLEAFKAKFQPVAWEPVYILSREPRISLATLWAVAGVYCGGSPLATGVRALGAAVRTEVRWLFGSARPQSAHHPRGKRQAA